jgi:hypothetical protein
MWPPSLTEKPLPGAVMESSMVPSRLMHFTKAPSKQIRKESEAEVEFSYPSLPPNGRRWYGGACGVQYRRVPLSLFPRNT